MIRYQSQRQLTLDQFDWPFQVSLDENNRWVKLGECIPWDKLAERYNQCFTSNTGRPTKDARLVIGAVIIKHKLNLTDRETVSQIQENPYLQFFVGLPGYQMKAPFAHSLLVEIRKRMGQSVFDDFQQVIIDSVVDKKRNLQRKMKVSSEEKSPKPDDHEPPSGGQAMEDVSVPESSQEPEHQGKLILDATVAPQAIRYPTDLNLLNEAREFSEKIIDTLYPQTDQKKKPRTYRVKARKAYLSIAKQKRPTAKTRRKGNKQQLQYLRRNLGHIKQLLEYWPPGTTVPLPGWLMHRYWVIQHVYQQQWEMYQNKTRRCDHRIVSISQPHVRPIVRGKLDKAVEFGAKVSASLNGDGIACVDNLKWDAFHEGGDLKAQVEVYRKRMGCYPEAVYADPAYGSRENRAYLKRRGIRFAGKPLGRPRKETEENREELKQLKAQRREDYLQRIPIEGKFGQGKSAHRLNYIRAKRADTSVSWINSIFLVMNLAVLLRLFFALWKRVVTRLLAWKISAITTELTHLTLNFKGLWEIQSPCRLESGC
ncbi:MAG: IS5 family transposase [Gammaproteobacteria bacterium]|nr:IS5 family transposase [Gammaproteobacteria bacterium]